MDREQNLIITSKVKENILVESEVAKVTPPARRKKAEKRNKTGDNSSLPACSQGSTISYGGTHTQAVEKSLKQDVKENREPVNEKNLSEREVTDTKSPETKNGVLKDSCVGEISSSNTGSNGTCVVNSFAGSHDVAVSANDTESVLSSNGNAETEKDSNLRNASEDGKKLPHGFENSREECVSPQDEESFFSAGEEAETYQDKSVTLPEAAEIVEGTSTQSENIDGSALINGKSSNEGEEATALTVDCEEICEFQKSDQTKQRSIFQASEESSENIGNVKEPSLDSIDTKTSSVLKDDANVSDLFRTDSPDSDLLVETESGAVEGTEPCFSDSEQEWSSSSYTSSEGEYDVGFAEEARGIKEEQGTEQDNCIDKVFCVEEILSAFPGFTQIVNVTTDSEDDSNKGDSLTNTFKTVEDSTRENEVFPLNIMSDDDDDGIQMLSHFPPSVCPVMVEITANDSIDDGNSSKQSSKVEGESCNDQRTLAVSTKDEMVPTSNSDQGGENVSDTINYPTKNALLEESHDTKIVDDLESQPVKRTGSFCLINNDGVLKVVDTGQTPVNTENGKDAKLLETNGREVISPDSRVVQSNSDKARKQLGETISETSDLDKEFQNVCKNIEKLEMMSEHNVESSDEFTNETSKDSSGQNREDSKAMVIVVDSMVSTEQTTKLEIKGVTINESASEDCVDGQKDEEINESKEDINTRSPVLVAKRHPKRLLNITRYSLDTQSALLSPEDDAPVELKKIQNSGSFKRGGSSALASESEADGRSPDGQSPDGQQHDKVTPSPPPRGTTNKKPLGHSSSFNTAAVRQLHQREVGKRSKRGRSERSMTLPNNVFDVASRLFTSSSSPEPVHQDPVTLITDNMPATFPGFPIHRRAQIALELYTTERSYVRGLETVVQLFLKPCEENKLLEKKEIKTMFGNLKEIFQINKDVLFNLLYLINHWHDKDQCVGDIFTDEVIERMKIYANYCTNYDSAEALYKQKIKKKEFEVFLNSCYEHPVCQPGLNLPAYLITVVQRIPRYLLLLEDLYKRTPENHPDRNKLNKALTKMSNVAVFINNKLQTSVGQKAMVELRSRVEGLKAFEGQALIKEADVVLSGKKTRKCLLFGDTVVFAVKGVSKTSEVEQTLELATLWCMDLEGNNPQSGKEDSLEIYTPEQSYIIEAGTKTEKKDWLQKLRTRIAMVLHGVEATDKYEIETRKATFKYKNEQVFCGNFVSGKRTGEGILSWPNQARYQGNWEDDDRNGFGELTYNSGDKYKGEWLDDKQHGNGEMEYTNGDIYRGQWYEGDMHGQGTITFKNGDEFSGQFCHNEIQGTGKLCCVSGLTYKGEWTHSKKHGKGTMQSTNGDVYSGQFANDRFSGQGEMHYADGSVYKGQWMDNQRGGYGEYRRSDGTHYLGGWSGDHITGKGCMKYANGDCYDGNWFKNTRFGQGVMKYSNGDIYEGVFEYDLRSKTGKMTYKDGSVYEGCWANGLRHGKGKMMYSDKKSMYEGEWMLGLRHGKGQMKYSNGASYSGHWEFDKRNGRGMYADPSSDYRYEGEWKNGHKHGKGVEQTPEGTYEGEWKDNMRHGQGREMSVCVTEFEGKWKEHRKHGPGIKRLKNGRVEEQVWQEGKHRDTSSIDVIELPLIQRR